MRLLLRFCSSLAVKTLKEKTKKVPKKIKYISEVDDYLKKSSTRANVTAIPSRFKNCLSYPPDSLICVDSVAASTYYYSYNSEKMYIKYHNSYTGIIAAAVVKNVTTGTLQDLPVLEMAPGPGLLSTELLKSGANLLRLYEPQPQFNGHLQMKASGQDEANKMQVFPQDLHNLARILFMDQALQLGQMDNIMVDLNSGIYIFLKLFRDTFASK